MNSFARNLLNERRKRLVAELMQYLETNVFDSLLPPERAALRDKVLSAVSQYHDVCLDMLKASVNDGVAFNEEALRLLASINREVKQ